MSTAPRISETGDPTDVMLSAQPDDYSLMSGVQRAEPSAIEALFIRHRSLLKSVIVRIVRDYASADDVLQECLLETWRRADTYSREKGTPLAWMITMAKRRAIDYVRRSQTYSNACDRFQSEPAPFTTVQDAARDCESSDLAQKLDQHLDKLPDCQREVVRLVFLQGMSYREVAQQTQSPISTVKTRMDLALRKLRSSLALTHLDLSDELPVKGESLDRRLSRLNSKAQEVQSQHLRLMREAFFLSGKFRAVAATVQAAIDRDAPFHEAQTPASFAVLPLGAQEARVTDPAACCEPARKCG